jgi:two-component system nitrogen regulation response regulator NtrX
VVPLRVPSLKERREDIPMLAQYLMGRAAEMAGVPVRRFGEDALAVLQTYDWPGNVRQLRNVIDWLLIMAPGDATEPIVARMMPPEIAGETSATLGAFGNGEIMSLPLREARELFERHYLDAQVARFGGNISRTAAFIGMERSALHRKLRALGIVTNDRERVEG